MTQTSWLTFLDVLDVIQALSLFVIGFAAAIVIMMCLEIFGVIKRSSE